MKQVALKDICSKDSSSLKQKELLETGAYPVYGASGIAGYLNSYHQENEYIGIVKDGSGIGRVSFYPKKTSLIGTMQYILPKNGYNIRYIGYCLQSLDLSKYKQGAAIPHIYFRDYGERKVNVTDDLKEQQRIVSRLDSAFAHIDELKANAEKQLGEARALFQKALAKAMEPKEGWEEKTLGEVAVFSQGIQVDVNLQTEKCSPDKVRFLRIIDVTQGNVPPRYIDDPGERYYLKSDEIAMVRYGTVGYVCYGFEGVIANNLFKISIKDKSKLQSNYLQFYLKSNLFQSHIRKGVGGAALPAIKFGDIKNLLLGVPPLSEQQRIVARLDALSDHVKALEENQRKVIAECDALKQALLRKVFE